jgi:hypothetical protein
MKINNTSRFVFVSLIVAVISITSFGQETKMIDFFPDAKHIDFSDLWTLDSILIENDSLIERKQPLGFIGDNFQRINIRFISVIQNPDNKYEYLVYGKTRVKDNICDFCIFRSIVYHPFRSKVYH